MCGYADFRSDAFCRTFIAHTLKEDMPPMPADVKSEIAYAHARMRMLARPLGEPDALVLDDTLRRALALAARVREPGVSPRARQTRLRLAARAALKIGLDQPLPSRQAYLRGCAAAAQCLARLIYPDNEKDFMQTDKE